MTDLPIACSLGPASLKARRDGLLTDLVRRAERREELPDGHHLWFAASDEVLSLITRTINAERLCCRFLRFQVTVEPDEGPVLLSLTGPPGTREFIAALLDEPVRSSSSGSRPDRDAKDR